MVADDPSAYEGQPCFEFVAEVPTTWDETRFVAGQVGEYIVVARRQGKNWYLGGITNWTKRELTIPFDFLGDGTFAATLYQDGSLNEEEPNAIRIEEREVSAAAPLHVSLAPGGGIAAVFRPN
jgi:alpha-glucosidase